jgi:4-hydroxy-tetrahydrodipicolinate reductase
MTGGIGQTVRDATPRLAIIGDGKMGRTLVQLAAERGFRMCALIDAKNNQNGTGITRGALNGADVAVEFTEPAAAVANIEAALRARVPLVVGTTGWYAELPRIRELVAQETGSLFVAPNFSIGVAVFARLAARAGQSMSSLRQFDAHILETHHAAKKDAPSGTGAMLRDLVARPLGRAVPVTSVRTGSVPGTHEIIFDAPFEQIRMTHEARDRRVFADGALVAARWLIGRTGVFGMDDLLDSLDQ